MPRTRKHSRHRRRHYGGRVKTAVKKYGKYVAAVAAIPIAAKLAHNGPKYYDNFKKFKERLNEEIARQHTKYVNSLPVGEQYSYHLKNLSTNLKMPRKITKQSGLL